MVIGYAPYHIRHGKFIEKLLALEYFSQAAIAAATAGFDYPATCVGTNMAYRKKLYIDVGGFGKFKPFISGDDDLFLTRIRGIGKYKIAYAISSETQVFNNPPGSFVKFFHQRMRYASKGFYYQPSITLSLSAYYLLNVFFLTGTALTLTGFFPAYLIGGVLSAKILIEYLFLRKAGKILGDTRSFSLIVPASLLHIPYVILFGLLGQFKYFKWAEKHSEKAIQQYANS
jgi:cellulose synthase/poly-beta-1,6-N-acetylglucosamine synthase-like glycosyltransferase